MSKELAARILQQYGLQPVRVHAVQKGYRNESFAAALPDGQMVNLIIYKREPGIVDKIRNANYVSNFLAAQGIPARQSLAPQIAQLQASNTVQYAALYNYLPGTTIPWETYTMNHIKQLGAAMSTMHATLRALPRHNLPSVADECYTLLERMERYFADSGVRRALSAKLGLSARGTTGLRQTLDACAQRPAQALHMDFVRGNILFSPAEPAITGILDFEKAAWGPPVFDIARTLAFLIVDCKYKTEPEVRKYFLQSGYNKRGKSSFAPTAQFERLVDFYLLHDFYKFLRHNPYESLEQNQHFVRTRGFLLKRNIIARAKMLQYP